MPITSRVLQSIRPIAGGRIWAREILTHSRGVIRHAVTADDEAAAIVTMNARDMTEQLRDEERTAVITFVRDGLGTPDDYVHVDLTAAGKRKAALRHFATTRFNDDVDFHLNIAIWIAGAPANGLTIATIASLLSISIARANTIKDRARDRIAAGGLNAQHASDDAAVDEDID